MSESALSADDAPLVSEDFLQGDVRVGLERMRKRLLDLTARNRLLNFPQRPSKTSLRAVDELPDQLFRHLIAGRKLIFRPVPRPPGVPIPSEEPDSEAAQTSSRGRLRYPSAKEQAEKLGLTTSFDLPESAGDEHEERHTDREIQTLHYPEDLEAILRKISNAARLAIEETGSNMLYLVFGFLEWYESPDSEVARFAPLLLLPATLERENVDDTGSIRFSIRHSGEDVAANVSLQERVKRDFGIDMPPLGEEETPEAYLAKLRFISERYPRWCVRRQVTLTLLSFGKILMYKDLDPETWPADRSPADHDRIGEFFRGIQRDSISFAEDYSLDDPAIASSVPMLVDEADSSQHSALVDALAGKNLVIEGPPGTGKSQTITNLIAGAVAAGRTVLFISDKLAALEVVRERLNKVGLGNFCLELHSHKAQKKQLLADIDERLNAYGRFDDAVGLDSKLRSVRDDRARLTSYVQLINRPFGDLGRTLHEIVWSARRQRARLPFPPDLIEGLSLQEAQRVTPEILSDCAQESFQFTTHLRTIFAEHDALADHPWFGVRNAELTFADEEGIATLLESCRQANLELIETVRKANEEGGIRLFGDTPAEIEQATQAIRSLPTVPREIIAELLPALRNGVARATLLSFVELVGRCRRCISAIGDLVGVVPRVSPPEIAEIGRLAARAREMLPGARRVGDVGQKAASCQAIAAAINEAQTVIEHLNLALGASIPLSRDGVAASAETMRATGLCPVDEIHLRHAGLDAPGAESGLEAAAHEAGALRAQRESLGRRFDLSVAPPTSEIRRHLVVMSNARWWSFLSSGFRTARRAYATMAIGDQRPSKQEMRAGFRVLHDFAVARQTFEESVNRRSLGGPHFVGIDTPFDAMHRLLTWRVRVSSELAQFGVLGSHAAQCVWSAGSASLRSLRDRFSVDHGAGPVLIAATEAVASIGAQEIPGLRVTEDWGALREQIGQVGSELSAIARRLAELNMPSHLSFEVVPEVVRQLTELNDVVRMIRDSRPAQELLGEQYEGTSTDIARIERTLSLFDAIDASAASAAVKEWLIDQDVHSRLAHARRCVATVSGSGEVVQTCWREAVSMLHLEANSWFGTDRPAELAVTNHVHRIDRALDARELLAGWLDYLRSRTPLVARGLALIAELAETRKIPVDAVADGSSFVILNSLIRAAFAAHPELARFSGLSHDQVRQRFAQMDRESIELYRTRAARLTDRRHIPAGNGLGSVRTYTERHLIEHEISKQRAHLPLRQLMLRAGQALQALKPCFMMGPLSVAQYLTPGALTFDLVVMDEASQLRPEDALGSVARGSQIVVVGDRMQLPPTSFFDRLGDEGDEPDEDAAAVTEAESILDIASATYKPSRMLRWHYRSRHGSLVAFSNKEFYRGRLVVFPSPVPVSTGRGVKLVYVKDGVYESSRNTIEARRVVETAIRFMERNRSESLGLVAMNAPQRELIEDMLESAVKRSPAAQQYIAGTSEGLEPFFVKNLENVQGDERDVIYISNTYGRSPGGQLYQRFGPINGPTGHRRLNVLFTRARLRVVVFSSMLAEDILAAPTSSWGVRALKGYLQYAQTGILESASFSGREPDSDFEIEVAEQLRARGYDVVAQVGVAGYFIDLAVRHPHKNDCFILGIECDGRTYHSGLSARDRDRLRQQVLEGLGWNIHRVWSTDWYKQPKIEVDRVVARLDHIVNTLGSESVLFDGELGDLESVAPANAASDDGRDDSWEGELAAQPLSVDDVRDQLLALSREMRRGNSEVRPDESLFRSEMIEALLRCRPKDKGDWLRDVPFDLRMATDGDELQAYLPRVLEITGRLATRGEAPSGRTPQPGTRPAY